MRAPGLRERSVCRCSELEAGTVTPARGPPEHRTAEEKDEWTGGDRLVLQRTSKQNLMASFSSGLLAWTVIIITADEGTERLSTCRSGSGDFQQQQSETEDGESHVFLETMAGLEFSESPMSRGLFTSGYAASFCATANVESYQRPNQFLYFEFNLIGEVAPGSLEPMPSLQLLFLNSNLLRSLPPGLFSAVRLARLNLRHNHFLHLPAAGLLEDLTALVQVGGAAGWSWGVELVGGAGGWSWGVALVGGAGGWSCWVALVGGAGGWTLGGGWSWWVGYGGWSWGGGAGGWSWWVELVGGAGGWCCWVALVGGAGGVELVGGAGGWSWWVDMGGGADGVELVGWSWWGGADGVELVGWSWWVELVGWSWWGGAGGVELVGGAGGWSWWVELVGWSWWGGAGGVELVDLQQNPWACDCEAVPLKRWLEGLSAVVVMGEVVCHSPDDSALTDLRSLPLPLLCPDMEPQAQGDAQPGGGAEPEATSDPPPDGPPPEGQSSPGPGPAAAAPPGRESIPLSVLVLSLLVLLVSAFFAAAALIAYALRRRDKLPFRRQGEVDLAGIQMECGIFTEPTHHHHHQQQQHHQHHQHPHHPHHGLPETPPPQLPCAHGPEHNHVYDTIPVEPGAPGPQGPAAPDQGPRPHGGVGGGGGVCGGVFKEEQDAAVRQRHPQQQQQQQQQQPGFQGPAGGQGGYRSAAEKEREWTLDVSSSPIVTVAGAMGPLAGLHGNGILCPTVIDSQGPTPKIELVDCLFRLPAPEFRDLPDRYKRPPPRYPHPPDRKQADGATPPGGGAPLAPASGGGAVAAGDGAGGRGMPSPDYMEVLDRSYQF
ncbi:unnamed protein product [Arctogadus glacialis]